MKDLILDGSFASISHRDVAHPGLRTAKIVYLDDQPNSNGYGIKYEDFEDIKKTIIGTPVKMRFIGSGVAGHKGSIPIGHIQGVMEAENSGVHQLIIDTILYADDYPDEIDWLESALEESKNDPSKIPGVSFEITYHNSVLENGVEWIKGLVARAATFVRTPAYGNRTALLALAADKELSADDFITELSALINNNSPKIPDKGGNNSMEEDLKRLQAELDALKIDLAAKEKEITEKSEVITVLTTEKEALASSLTEKETLLAEYKEKEVLTTRQATLAEAGIELEIKPERIVKMAEDEFAAYVDDLKAVVDSTKKSAKDDKRLLASHREVQRLPKFESDNGTEVSAVDLAGKFKSYSRSQASEDTE